jgi:hypothetical protein
MKKFSKKAVSEIVDTAVLSALKKKGYVVVPKVAYDLMKEGILNEICSDGPKGDGLNKALDFDAGKEITDEVEKY